MKFSVPIILCFYFLSFSGNVWSQQQLLIDSQSLASRIEVQIFHLGDQKQAEHIIYLTDGKQLLEHGALEQLQSLDLKGQLKPSYYVFVGATDQKDLLNKRNEYFFCNPSYIDFFEKELIPKVEALIGQTFSSEQSALVGVSFGGLNAAWFSAQSSSFLKYALLSPITYPCPSIISNIAFSNYEGLQIFISSGVNDAENYTQPLSAIYQSKGYQVLEHYTQEGHSFESWIKQFKEVIAFFFP